MGRLWREGLIHDPWRSSSEGRRDSIFRFDGSLVDFSRLGLLILGRGVVPELLLFSGSRTKNLHALLEDVGEKAQQMEEIDVLVIELLIGQFYIMERISLTGRTRCAKRFVRW